MVPKEIVEFHQWFGANYYGRLAARAASMCQACLIAASRGARTIVETGTTRAVDHWSGDGQSTVVFGSYCQKFGGRLWTVDISEQAMAASRKASFAFRDFIDYRVEDSIGFLQNFDRPIDLLYLDSYDFPTDGSDHNPSQEHSLKEAQAALPRLHNQSVIVIDDCGLPHGGKGGKVVPFLLGEGWQVVGLGYQIVLTSAFPYRS